MKRVLILVLVIFFVFTYTSSYASVYEPKKINLGGEEFKRGQEENGACYDQTAYTDCGSFEYTVCFENEPTTERFLNVIDIIDDFINANCL